jgi:hypothetical protein
MVDIEDLKNKVMDMLMEHRNVMIDCKESHYQSYANLRDVLIETKKLGEKDEGALRVALDELMEDRLVIIDKTIYRLSKEGRKFVWNRKSSGL